VNKCIDRILNTNKGGYVFHATGSGKTLTSYLLSRDLSRNEKIDKVLFVIDRNDLGTQTQDNFSKYASNGSKVQPKYDVDNTKDLVNKLNDKNVKLIITSIQKLAGAIRNADNHEVLKTIQDKKIVFIYDECHRSQAGDMRKTIDDFFKSPQTIGFTGTPIYKMSQTASGLRTEDIFGDCLHTYSIMNSVIDGNTLYYDIKYLGQYKIIKEDDKKATSLD
jgi:type I restriction enzyme R subunit